MFILSKSGNLKHFSSQFVHHCQKRAKSVVIGLSGGVDSAVSAYLLKKQGYDVQAVYMKNWSIEEETGHSVCPFKDDLKDAQQIADFLHIPLEIVDFEKQYWLNVFQPCLDAYRDDLTPNPDVLCNRYIKFDVFANRYISQGYDYIATGHYCLINKSTPLSSFTSSPCELLRGSDLSKDQSYFLSQINSNLLNHILFPVGNYLKKDVKLLARQIGLHVEKKKESMGICFIGERNMKNFLNDYLTGIPGDIVTIDGKFVGRHDGLMFYTIGQGMKIANQITKLYVCDKRKDTNELVVCDAHNNALYKQHISIDGKDMIWMSPSALERIITKCKHDSHQYPIQCQLRYQTTAYPCRIESVTSDNKIIVTSQVPMRAVTPGQVCVFYDNKVCLGGGQIV